MMREVMLGQELVATTNVFGDGAEGWFAGEESPRFDLGLDLRPVFQWPHGQPREEERNAGDGAYGEDGGQNRFWAVATPLGAAWQPPNAFGAGVATAQVIEQICSLRRRQSCSRIIEQKLKETGKKEGTRRH